MSILVVLIPPRARTATRPAGANASGAARAGIEYVYALSTGGLTVTSEGRATAARLPRADSAIAVLSEADVAWHRVTLPKVVGARMRSALVGILEEALLDDAEQVHLALAPNAVGGKPAWVAAINKSWLSSELNALERANVFVDRVVPSAWPDEPAIGHFAEADPGGPPGDIALTWASMTGVATMRLQGTLARALVGSASTASSRWSATPAVAAPAERWLGMPVVVMSPGERALQASRSLWNLRQFDLTPRTRGKRVLSGLSRRVRSPDWRPARVGLAVLLVAQLVGLNVWALHQRVALDSRREAMTALLRTTFPQTRTVYDAPVQMQREVQALRAAAGRPGDSDLEPLLAAASSAWPDGRPPADTLRFESGRLTVSSASWSDAQIEQFRSRLQGYGLQVEAAGGRLTLTRGRVGGTI